MIGYTFSDQPDTKGVTVTAHRPLRTAKETFDDQGLDWLVQPGGHLALPRTRWQVPSFQPVTDQGADQDTAAPNATTCALRRQAESVRTARNFTKLTLQNWGMVELIHDLGLIVSELVTNALRHALALDALDAGVTAPDPWPVAHLDPQYPVRLGLLRNGFHVTCAVTDPSTDIPVRTDPDFVTQTGRGLHLVESFSRVWGWSMLGGGGKVVWASI